MQNIAIMKKQEQYKQIVRIKRKTIQQKYMQEQIVEMVEVLEIQEILQEEIRLVEQVETHLEEAQEEQQKLKLQE